MLGKQQIKEVDDALAWIKIVHETNKLIYAVSVLVAGGNWVWRFKGKERKYQTCGGRRIEFKITDRGKDLIIPCTVWAPSEKKNVSIVKKSRTKLKQNSELNNGNAMRG